jgi:hypothetical protein
LLETLNKKLENSLTMGVHDKHIRPERPIDFLAKYLRSENPLACKIKCRRHSAATCYCKVVVDLPPPPPPPPPKKKKKEDEEEEEAA